MKAAPRSSQIPAKLPIAASPQQRTRLAGDVFIASPQIFASKIAAGAAVVLCGVSGVQAQSTARLYGSIDLSIAYDRSPGGRTSKTGVESGKITTSYFGFAGTEDLGHGMAAVFALESFIRADSGGIGRFNGDAFLARNSYVGLQGGFGRVTVGRHATALFASTLSFNAFGSSFGYSPSIRHYFTSGTVTGDTVWNDSVSYTSPKFGGWSATVQAALAEGAGGRNWGGSVLYVDGPLGATVAYQDVKKGATTQRTQTWQLGASYDFNVAKVFAQYGQVKNDVVQLHYKLAELGFVVPLGRGKVMLSYGNLKPTTGAARNTVSAGYSYLLSNRTDLYAVAMNDKIDGRASGRSYAIGIRHGF